MVLENDPSSNSARFNMARTLAAMGDHAGAIREYRSVCCRQQPNDVAARYQLGLSYAAVGRKSDAVTEMNRALQMETRSQTRSLRCARNSSRSRPGEPANHLDTNVNEQPRQSSAVEWKWGVLAPWE